MTNLSLRQKSRGTRLPYIFMAHVIHLLWPLRLPPRARSRIPGAPMDPAHRPSPVAWQTPSKHQASAKLQAPNSKLQTPNSKRCPSRLPYVTSRRRWGRLVTRLGPGVGQDHVIRAEFQLARNEVMRMTSLGRLLPHPPFWVANEIALRWRLR